jgi:DNA-binding transcriptional MerR regulator
LIMTSGGSEIAIIRHGTKSPTAFRTIAEVATELSLPPHVLRFWESKFSQIKPLKRRGGRRYYRPEDVALLRRIRSLLYTEGYTIKGVQRLLREGIGKTPAASSASPTSERRRGGEAGTEPDHAMVVVDRRELEVIVRELEAIRDLLRGA